MLFGEMSIKNQFIYSVMFTVIALFGSLLINILIFPYMWSCKDSGEALVVDVEYKWSDDPNDNSRLYYSPTYEIEGMKIKATTAVSERVEIGDTVPVIYNLEHGVCYSDMAKTTCIVSNVFIEVFWFISIFECLWVTMRLIKVFIMSLLFKKK